MAARPTWKGYLRLSLVACRIRLYPAMTRRDRISFHWLNPKTNNRIEMRAHDADSGDEVARDSLVRGYEFDKGRFVVVDDDEIEALRIESSETIDLVRFVDEKEVDPLYFSNAYYVTPEGKVADETFRVIQEAMRQERKAGIGRLVLSQREHPVLLAPRHRGMLLTTLRDVHEIRDEKDYFADIDSGKLDKDMVEMARRIIEQKSGRFDVEELAGDRYQEALRELVQHKIRGEKPVRSKTAAGGGNVVNLMDALKRSLADERKPPAATRKRAAGAARKRAPSRRSRRA